jgi:hypothetical protein
MRIQVEQEGKEAGPDEPAGSEDLQDQDRPPEDEDDGVGWPVFEPVEKLVAEEDPENQVTD